MKENDADELTTRRLQRRSTVSDKPTYFMKDKNGSHFLYCEVVENKRQVGIKMQTKSDIAF